MQHVEAFVIGRQKAGPSETRLILLASSAMVALTLFVLLFLQPTYQTNDDAAMRMTASGLRTGAPSEYLIHINILVGRVLKFLYETSPAVHWYDVYLYGNIVTAMAAMTFSLLRLSAPRRWLSPVFPVVIYPFVAIQPQFTITSGLCAGAAALLVISSAIQPPPSRAGWIGLSVLVATCSVLAVSLRSNQALVVFGVVVLSALPLLLVRYGRHLWPGPLLLVLLALGVGFAIHVIAQHEYLKNEGFRQFAELNTYRVAIQEYLAPRWQDLGERAVLEAAGWSVADYRMFFSWFTTNENLFGLEALKQIRAGLLAIQSPSVGPGIWDMALRESEILWNRNYLLLGLAAAALLVLPSRWWGMLALLSAVVASIAAAVVMEYASKVPPFRVMFPILICCFTVAVLFAAPTRSQRVGSSSRLDRALTAVGFLGLLAAAGFIAADVLRLSGANKTEIAAIAEDMENYDGTGRIHVWGLLPRFSSVYYLPPFTSARPFTWVGLGWATLAPIEKGKREALGLHDLPLDLCTNPDLYHMADMKNFYILQEYILQHYHIETKAEMVYSGNRLQIYRCVQE